MLIGAKKTHERGSVLAEMAITIFSLVAISSMIFATSRLVLSRIWLESMTSTLMTAAQDSSAVWNSPKERIDDLKQDLLTTSQIPSYLSDVTIDVDDSSKDIVINASAKVRVEPGGSSSLNMSGGNDRTIEVSLKSSPLDIHKILESYDNDNTFTTPLQVDCCGSEGGGGGCVSSGNWSCGSSLVNYQVEDLTNY